MPVAPYLIADSRIVTRLTVRWETQTTENTEEGNIMVIQQQYRRRQSRPATLLTQLPSVRRMGEVNQEEEFEEEEFEEEVGGNGAYNAGPSEPTEGEVEAGNAENEWGTDHITRTGVPDRRFKENRALTEADVGQTQYRKASVGRVVNGVHVTEDGIPDRRFKENRALSDEEIEIRRAELILAKHGITKNQISPQAILASHAPRPEPSEAVTQTRMQAQGESPLQRVARASGTRHKASQAKPTARAAGSKRR